MAIICQCCVYCRLVKFNWTLRTFLPATTFWRPKTAICKVFIRQVGTLKKPFTQGTAMVLSLFSPQHLKPSAVPPTSQLTGKCVWEGVWAPECALNAECQIRLSFCVYLYISTCNTQTDCDKLSDPWCWRVFEWLAFKSLLSVLCTHSICLTRWENVFVLSSSLSCYNQDQLVSSFVSDEWTESYWCAIFVDSFLYELVRVFTPQLC